MVLTLDSVLRTVFMIYAGFWTAVILGLLVVVGMLLKKHDRLVEKHRHGGGH